MRIRSFLMLAVVSVSILASGAAHAGRPSNDNFSAATSIDQLPFQSTQDTTEATTEPLEPEGSCARPGATVWFSYTSDADRQISITTTGSTFNTVINVYPAPPVPGISGNIDCGSDSRLGETFYPAKVTVGIASGQTLWVQIGGVATWLPTRTAETGSLQVQVVEVDITPKLHPPVNDARQNALEISSLPFSDYQYLYSATAELLEPGCDGIPERLPVLGYGQTVWYRYVAPSDKTLNVRLHRAFGGSGFVVFRVAGLELEPVLCGIDHDGGDEYSDPDITRGKFGARQGETYLIQVAGGYHRWATDIDIEEAPSGDMAVTNLEVGDHADWNPAWTKAASFDVTFGTGPYVLDYAVSLCPREAAEDPKHCSQVAQDRIRHYDIFRNVAHITAPFGDWSCFGDLMLKVEVTPTFGTDIDTTNNIIATPYAAKGAGMGQGRCV